MARKRTTKRVAKKGESKAAMARSRAPRLQNLEERQRFKELIFANPNYFGNLKGSKFKAQLQIQSNTTYEEIGCVGYQPQFNRLEAVVYVKQSSGYGGDVCTDGTPEYVRFFVSSDNGLTWTDEGLASFTAYDIPEGTTGARRLEYAVSRDFAAARKFCFLDNILLVRAILSWNVPPPENDPDFTPVWGSVHETHVQVDPFKLVILGDLLKALEIKPTPVLAQALDLAQSVKSNEKTLGAIELQKLYHGKKVEPHRFAFAEVHKLVSQPNLSELVMAPGFEAALPGLKVDLADILGKLFPVDGNTSYEELECVGLNPNLDTLVGVIRVKLPLGYSGGPCTAGSKEYVTFWADFNGNGTFETCLGTTSVTVYDIDDIPPEGLEYAVFLPVDLAAHRRPCEEGPKVVRIRAILSWQTPAPCANPNYIPVWGNREETLIHVKPGESVQPGDRVPILSSAGDIAVPDIDSSGIANGVGNFTGFLAVDSPFGGRINLAGKIVNGTAASRYRVMLKPHGAPDSAYVPITNEPQGLKLTLVTFNGGLTIDPNFVIHADSNGYYTYEDYASNHFIDGNILMRWFTGAAEDGQTFDLRVDLSVDGNPANDIHSNMVTILVDNTRPEVDLDIDLGTGVDCADFEVGATFTGTYTATDDYFRQFWFEILPSGPAGGVLPSPPSGLSSHLVGGTIPDPGVAGGTYTLNTTGMEPCGYSLTIHATDRTNVNSGTARHHNETSVGFCLRES